MAVSACICSPAQMLIQNNLGPALGFSEARVPTCVSSALWYVCDDDSIQGDGEGQYLPHSPAI